MKQHFEFALEEHWPRLAWIAHCTAGDPVIRVRHGAQVEARPEWFCEAIWEGPFPDGDFDQTDLVFGSGARLRGDRVVFVPSGSTVDRLHVLRRKDGAAVSNSLACLLACTGTQVDASYAEWFEFFVSVKQGIDAFNRRLPTAGKDDLELVYFRNLSWDGQRMAELDKPAPRRDFATFAGYHGFMTSAIGRLAVNMADAARSHRYRMLGTLSSGYDAATCSTLCRGAGLEEAVSSRSARGSGGADDGRAVADALGLKLTLIDRAGWRTRDMPEVPFFAANPRGGEVFLSGAEGLLRGRVLITGFHGDKVWGKETQALGPDLVRGDMSGLSLCEYRLQVGFIQFPPAFMGVRQIADINRLSNSPELAPWDVLGDYSRPICRRIIEEAGVPRDAFGTRKKMASVHFGHGESLLTERTRRDYHGWLRANKAVWERAGRQVPSVPSRALVAFRERYYLFDRAAGAIARMLPAAAEARVERAVATLQNRLNQRINQPDHIFPWAIGRIVERYGPAHEADEG